MTHQVGREGLALGIPEGVHEDLVVLDGDGANRGAQVEGAALEHDAVLVVDAGALREDQQRRGVGCLHMRLHALRHDQPVLNLRNGAAASEGCAPLVASSCAG